MVIMPFTYCIPNGIGAGFVSFAVIKVLRGKARDVHPMMAIAVVAVVAYFATYYLQRALGAA
jgi:AGZA family xanthine/uracil permease-like MFS transporter